MGRTAVKPFILKMKIPASIILALGCFCGPVPEGNAQSIIYQWLNQGCANVINCDNGCTACNLPENGSSTFFGTNMIFVGPTICPFPTSEGDNSIFSEGWPQTVSNDHYGLLSVIATTPMQIDSIVIRHARTTNGPHRLKVSYSPSPMEPFYEIADEYVDWNFEETVITDLGCLEIPDGTPYSTFQLKVQAYDATGEGSWALDEVRIAGSTCSTFSTAIPEREWNDGEQNVQFYDVLGRPVSGNVAPGVYSGGRRVITVH